MNIEYLRNYIKLTQYKNFSNLAKELPISQSTLSHQISQLEKDFGGVVLIDRTTKKFELTKAGKLILKHAKQIVDLYDSCKLEIFKFKDQKEHSIVYMKEAAAMILDATAAHYFEKLLDEHHER